MISSKIDHALNINQSENGGHTGERELKLNARTMSFMNNDLKNGLPNNKVPKIYFRRYDSQAG